MTPHDLKVILLSRGDHPVQTAQLPCGVSVIALIPDPVDMVWLELEEELIRIVGAEDRRNKKVDNYNCEVERNNAAFDRCKAEFDQFEFEHNHDSDMPDFDARLHAIDRTMNRIESIDRRLHRIGRGLDTRQKNIDNRLAQFEYKFGLAISAPRHKAGAA
jgi:hypothetical protein